MQIHLSSCKGQSAAGRAFLRQAGTLTAVWCLSTVPGNCLAQDPGAVQLPVVRSFTAPAYPVRALALGASGDVTMQFIIDAKGQPRCIQIVEATAPQLFAKTALSAIRRSRYRPPHVDGKPVAVPVRIVMRFAYTS
jgi:TonB family protein